MSGAVGRPPIYSDALIASAQQMLREADRTTSGRLARGELIRISATTGISMPVMKKLSLGLYLRARCQPEGAA